MRDKARQLELVTKDLIMSRAPQEPADLAHVHKNFKAMDSQLVDVE